MAPFMATAASGAGVALLAPRTPPPAYPPSLLAGQGAKVGPDPDEQHLWACGGEGSQASDITGSPKAAGSGRATSRSTSAGSSSSPGSSSPGTEDHQPLLLTPAPVLPPGLDPFIIPGLDDKAFAPGNLLLLPLPLLGLEDQAAIPSPSGCPSPPPGLERQAPLPTGSLSPPPGLERQVPWPLPACPPPPPGLLLLYEDTAVEGHLASPLPPPLLLRGPEPTTTFMEAQRWLPTPPPPAFAAPTLLPGAESRSLLSGPPAALAAGFVLELFSSGSTGHVEGSCKPCAFVHKQGCERGTACPFCHLCDAGEVGRRRKSKRAAQAARKAGQQEQSSQAE